MANFALSGWKEVELWAKTLWTELNNELWWKDKIGDGITNVVQRKTDLQAAKGHKILFGLRPRLTSSGQKAAQTNYTRKDELEGKEEDMTFYGDSVTISYYRHAVKHPGQFYVQKVPFDVKFNMKEALKVWAVEKLDGLFFTAFAGGNFNQSHIVTIGGNQAPGSMSLATNELTIADIRKLPILARQKRINPIKIGGRNYYYLLMHDDAAHRLMSKYSTNSQSWYEMMLQARERAPGNPLFQGAMGIIGGVGAGVILDRHDNANLFGTTSGPECYSLLLGAQAGLYAVAKPTSWTEKLFDYDDKLGIATGFMVGIKMATFNDDQHGAMSIRHYAPQIS